MLKFPAMFLQCCLKDFSIKKAKNQIQLITFKISYEFNGETTGVHWFNDLAKDLRSMGRKITYFLLPFCCLWHHYDTLQHPGRLLCWWLVGVLPAPNALLAWGLKEKNQLGTSHALLWFLRFMWEYFLRPGRLDVLSLSFEEVVKFPMELPDVKILKKNKTLNIWEQSWCWLLR